MAFVIGPGIGRIRMRQILNASAESLMPFVQDSIEPGSIIHTDGWLGYLPLEKKGYEHEITFLGLCPSSVPPLARVDLLSSVAQLVLYKRIAACSAIHGETSAAFLTARSSWRAPVRSSGSVWPIDGERKAIGRC